MRLLVLSICLCAILGSAAFAAEEINRIVAVVNDEIITHREFSSEYEVAVKDFEARDGALTADIARNLHTKVLDSLIDRLLVKQKIKELNIVISEEEVRQSIEEIKKQNELSQEGLVAALITQGMTFDQYKEQMRAKLERLRLMGQEVNSKVQVSEEEIKAYYSANLDRFTTETSYRARAIFLNLSLNPTVDEIRSMLMTLEAATAAARKGADFAELARKYSADLVGQKDGGDLGIFKKGEMLPEIEKIVLSLKPGDIDTVAAAGGFYLIKLEEKIPGTVKSFAEAKAAIEETLYEKKSEERFARWIKDLRRAAAIDTKTVTGVGAGSFQH